MDDVRTFVQPIKEQGCVSDHRINKYPAMKFLWSLVLHYHNQLEFYHLPL